MGESKSPVKGVWAKIKYEAGIFIFLAVSFLFQCHNPSYDGDWYETTFTLTYSRFGFQSRMLIGTIVSFFTDRVKLENIFAIHLITCLLLAVFISVLAGLVIKSTDGEIRNAVIVFTAFYLFAPTSITYIFNYTILLDTFLYIFFILAVICAMKNNFIFFVPLICVLSVATHQIFVAMYMPALGIILLYLFYKNNYSKKIMAVLIASCVAAGVLFVKFQFGETGLPFANAQEMAEYLQKTTDINVNVSMLYCEYFATNKALFYEYIGSDIAKSLKKAAVLAAVLLPILIIFTSLFVNAIKNAEKKILKFIFLLCAVIPAVSIVIYVMSTDWDRWSGMIVFEQTALTMFFLYIKEDAFVQSFRKMTSFFRRNKILAVLLIVFYASVTGLCGAYLGYFGNAVKTLLAY